MRVLTEWPGRLALWFAFLAIHVWLAFLVWDGPIQPFNDVIEIYRGWVEEGLRAHEWVGFQLPFVYPPLALLPMVIAAAGGTSVTAYGWTWLALVAILDAIAVLVLTLAGGTLARRRGTIAAWWWLAFLLLLGPVGLGRLEAVVTPIAIVGVAFIATRPTLATALLTIGAWIKIWPAAIVGAMLVTLRERSRVLIAALSVTTAVLTAGLLVGGLLGGDVSHLLSFLGGQGARGVQVESLLAAPWLLQAALGSVEAAVSWDQALNTFEVIGPGVEIAAAASTPLMLIGIIVIGVLGLLAVRRGADRIDVLVSASIALTCVLVVTNKVGSPQFAAWIAAPVVLAILARRGAVPAVGALLIAGLTQVVYPWGYSDVIAAQLPAVVVLELRNLLWVALLAWAIGELVRAMRSGAREAGRARSEVEA